MIRRRAVSVLAVVCAAAAAASCGGESDAGVTRVYFVDGYRSELGMRGRLKPQERRLAEPGLGRVVAELLRGPAPGERHEPRLITAFPRGVRVSTVALVNRTARVRLSSPIPPIQWSDGLYATAQLVYTLTAMERVERVALTVNGVRCCLYDMQRRPRAKPLTRRHFSAWQGRPYRNNSGRRGLGQPSWAKDSAHLHASEPPSQPTSAYGHAAQPRAHPSSPPRRP